MRHLREAAAGLALVVAGWCCSQAFDLGSRLREPSDPAPLFFERARKARQLPPAEVVDLEPALPVEPDPAPPKRRRVAAKVVAPVEAASAPALVAPEDAIRLALRLKHASLERCYEQELKKQAVFSGFIVVALSLSADGRVTAGHVEQSSRRDSPVGDCIVAQLRLLKLPPLTDDADVLIPIRLEAKKPTQDGQAGVPG